VSHQEGRQDVIVFEVRRRAWDPLYSRGFFKRRRGEGEGGGSEVMKGKRDGKQSRVWTLLSGRPVRRLKNQDES